MSVSRYLKNIWVALTNNMGVTQLEKQFKSIEDIQKQRIKDMQDKTKQYISEFKDGMLNVEARVYDSMDDYLKNHIRDYANHAIMEENELNKKLIEIFGTTDPDKVPTNPIITALELKQIVDSNQPPEVKVKELQESINEYIKALEKETGLKIL